MPPRCTWQTGEAGAALAILATIRERAPLKEVQAFIEGLRAQASEALGNYQEAYRQYVGMNQINRAPDIDPEWLIQSVASTEARDIGPLPPDPHTDDFMMLGFPRSGTTLLENALAAHPKIETLEEIPAFNPVVAFVNSTDPSEDPASVGLAARRLYYERVAQDRFKHDASIVVDKMPVRSVYANLLKKLFPEKRYIFSVRDPRDVVLSCFKQDFLPNPSMEHFRTFAGACRLYDFAMSRWFAHFTLDDHDVCYVRYERLVTDFESELRRTLDFLGAEWDPAVLTFAESAGRRAATTPSYQKVRQGLSLGVQSSWRNYKFLFDGRDARPLDKWIGFFGIRTHEVRITWPRHQEKRTDRAAPGCQTERTGFARLAEGGPSRYSGSVGEVAEWSKAPAC